MALRMLPKKMLTWRKSACRAVVRELLDLPRGLILVTGPTGSGKTTTLATMLDVINQTTPRHIITIEDPIEYFHRAQARHRQPAGSRRGCADFCRGLAPRLAAGSGRDSRRGNARPGDDGDRHHRRGDRATSFSPRSTPPARRAPWIASSMPFPPTQQEQIRVQLAIQPARPSSPSFCCPRMDGKGRVAAFEIMINTPSIAALHPRQQDLPHPERHPDRHRNTAWCRWRPRWWSST